MDQQTRSKRLLKTSTLLDRCAPRVHFRPFGAIWKSNEVSKNNLLTSKSSGSSDRIRTGDLRLERAAS